MLWYYLPGHSKYSSPTRSTYLSTRSTCLSTRCTRLSTCIARVSTRSTRSTRLSTRSTCLYTCSICLSTRTTHSTICRSFCNWSHKSLISDFKNYFYIAFALYLAFNFSTFSVYLWLVVWSKLVSVQFFLTRSQNNDLWIVCGE